MTYMKHAEKYAGQESNLRKSLERALDISNCTQLLRGMPPPSKAPEVSGIVRRGRALVSWACFQVFLFMGFSIIFKKNSQVQIAYLADLAGYYYFFPGTICKLLLNAELSRNTLFSRKDGLIFKSKRKNSRKT